VAARLPRDEFERLLVDDGIRPVSILLHVSAEEPAEEQLKRLRELSRTRLLKHWKIEAGDIGNFSRRRDHLVAMDDMLAQTSISLRSRSTKKLS